MQNTNFFIATRALTLLLAFSSCGPLNQMKEMNETTKQMNATTKEMNQNTQTMLKDMHEMLKQTQDMGMTTNKLDSKTARMAKVTEGMAEKHEKMIGIMEQMNGKMGTMIEEVKHTNSSMEEMKGEIKHTNQTIDGLSGVIVDMNGKMTVMTNEVKQANSSVTEMKGVLNETNTLMKDLSNDMKQMVGKIDAMMMLTQKMFESLRNMYDDMQMAYSNDSRMNILDKLDEAKDLNSKVGRAGMYMMAFDFQYWKPGAQSESDRKLMFNNAVMELLTIGQDYTNGFYLLPRQSQSDLDFYDPVYTAAVPSSIAGKRQGLFAIVATMHLVNPKQTQHFKGKYANTKVVSVYSLIKDGLISSKKVKEGKASLGALPVYQQEVHKKEQIALYLVQMRQNFLRAAVYDLLSQDAAGNSKTPVGSWIRSVLGLRWTPNLKDRNIAQINSAAEYLELSEETRKFLISIGQTPVRKEIIDDLYENMDLRSLKADQTPEGKAIARFIAAVDAAYPKRNYR